MIVVVLHKEIIIGIGSENKIDNKESDAKITAVIFNFIV